MHAAHVADNGLSTPFALMLLLQQSKCTARSAVLGMLTAATAGSPAAGFAWPAMDTANCALLLPLAHASIQTAAERKLNTWAKQTLNPHLLLGLPDGQSPLSPPWPQARG